MARRIVTLTAGTLGDVKPFVSLNLALKAAGYDVALAVPENFRPLVEAAGIESRRCGGDFKAALQHAGLRGFMSGSIRLQLLRLSVMPAPFKAVLYGAMRDAVAAAHDADAIIVHPLLMNGRDIAEGRGIPWIFWGPAPLTPTRELPLCIAPDATYGGLLNRLSYRIRDLEVVTHRKVINDIRQNGLGLASLGLGDAFRHARCRQPTATIYPISPSVLPRPGDWPENVHLTGFWFSDEDQSPLSETLETFVTTGDKPIFVGFGSMTGLTPERVRILIAACEAAGVRAVIASGWSGLDAEIARHSSKQFLVIDYAPYRTLFAKVKAAVHHGGLGTVSQSLRAGCPTLVCPITMDQPFWGHRVAALGAGPEPLPMASWTVRRLASKLEDLAGSTGFATRAAEVGRRITGENGILDAVDVIRRTLPN